MKEKYLNLAKCYENLAESYRALADGIDDSPTDTIKEDTNSVAETSEKTVTFEDVSLLAKKKAADGKSAGVKSIILRFNVKKLSDIQPESYADIIKELEAL